MAMTPETEVVELLARIACTTAKATHLDRRGSK
jgi:hypothetical protein